MINVINALQQLEKAEVIRLLRGANSSATQILLRALFELPPDVQHPRMWGANESLRDEVHPAYPLVVLEGAPLYLLRGMAGSGNPLSRHFFLDWYLEHGVLRSEAYRPPDDPLLIWEAWKTSTLRQAVFENEHQVVAKRHDEMVQVQLLRLVETIQPRIFTMASLRFRDVNAMWEEAATTLRNTPVRWDADRSMYVDAADGSFIEPKKEMVFQSFRWNPPVATGRSVEVIVVRLDEALVLITVRQTCTDSPPMEDLLVRVIAAEEGDREIAVLSVDGSFTSGVETTEAIPQLEMGVMLRALILRGDEVVTRSPVFTPDREARSR